jgi:signal transduction histidine kinase/CheY-like chemotaxis protein
MPESNRNLRFTLYLVGMIGFIVSVISSFLIFHGIGNRSALVLENILDARVDLYKERFYPENDYLSLVIHVIETSQEDVPSQLAKLNQTTQNPYLIGQYWVPLKPHHSISSQEIKTVFLRQDLMDSLDVNNTILEHLEDPTWQNYKNLTVPASIRNQKNESLPIVLLMSRVHEYNKGQHAIRGYLIHVLDINRIFATKETVPYQSTAILHELFPKNKSGEDLEASNLQVIVEQKTYPNFNPVIYTSSNWNDKAFNSLYGGVQANYFFTFNNLELNIRIARILPLNRLSFALFALLMGFAFTFLFMFLTYRGLRLEKESQARRFVQKQMKDKSDFFDVLSHELRTPLNGIVGMVHLLNQTELTNQQIHFANTIQLSAYSLETLVDQSLTLSRLNSFELEIEEHPFTINQMLNELIDSLGPLATLKNIALFYELPKELNGLSFFGDELRLKQVLINLIGNAIKFTEKGSVKLEVDFKNTSSIDQKIALTFRVIDTGFGISEEDRTKLFKKFSRIRHSRFVNLSEGGIGLQISQEIVRKMGGVIHFDSELTKGSQFYFTVELKQQAFDEKDITAFDLSSKRFLILTYPEDRELVDFANYLESKGAKVQMMHHIDVIHQYFARNNPSKAMPDLIYLNEHIQSDQGLVRSLSMHLQANHDFISRIIFLHATTDSVQRTQIFTHGFSVSYLKPFQENYLLKFSIEMMLSQLGRLKDTVQNTLTNQELFAQKQKYQVLIAEDNLVNLEIISNMVQYLGYRYQVAHHGAEVLNLLEDDPFDLILLDINMPEMSGLDVCKTIRQSDKSYQDIPIIAISANLDGQLKEMTQASGMNTYLSKPVELTDLEQKITEVLSYYQES